MELRAAVLTLCFSLAAGPGFAGSAQVSKSTEPVVPAGTGTPARTGVASFWADVVFADPATGKLAVRDRKGVELEFTIAPDSQFTHGGVRKPISFGELRHNDHVMVTCEGKIVRKVHRTWASPVTQTKKSGKERGSRR